MKVTFYAEVKKKTDSYSTSKVTPQIEKCQMIEFVGAGAARVIKIELDIPDDFWDTPTFVAHEENSASAIEAAKSDLKDTARALHP